MEHSMLFDDAREHHLLGGHHPIADMMGNAYERRLTRYEFSLKHLLLLCFFVVVFCVCTYTPTLTSISVCNYISMVKTAHIRHPCDRFISAFTYLTQAGNEGDKILTDKWIADQTIDEFASNYNTAGWNPNYEIRHFTPQVEFVFYTHDGINEDREHAHDKPDGTFGLDLIMCTEQWEEGLDRLGDALGKSLPSDLREKQDNHFEHQSCEELAPETREILERVYAMDYCVFDYSPLPSDKTTCVGSYTTPEMFSSKYKQCQAIHRPEVAKKKPEAVWPVSYLAKLKLASATDDDDSYGADDDELAAYLEDGIKINY
mmetsp:Transcript_18975/g.27558  ORF Transcript_18975/g.27558 Transcript_18975/m.27558 type:complete len:316 (-) Transcript_18975:184-1131(-)